ncbi:hypothetical protein [Bythopirellula goksoeyrii]|uniref:Uncharacterized protein n=1 Tax=Bythopirellula goksoeyrii TaxID=1400387 RepID=A0A5B9QF92_9BACT|nr:hypothetical protein [Bythopirellula goksoeyrii]QEG36320.1 hypothetical protein Pr1d_36330 [Bythopirellula goksoeyrii]
MQRFKNILLLYDCDRVTLERVATLSKNNRARLTVVQVIKEMPEQWQHVLLGRTPLDLQKLAKKVCESKLREFVAPLKQGGLRASTKVLTERRFTGYPYFLACAPMSNRHWSRMAAR